MSQRPRGRLNPLIGKARHQLRQALAEYTPAAGSRTGVAHAGDRPLILVACSGGPDSLALAFIASFFASRGDYRVGAVVVDHGLQDVSAKVAATTATKLQDLGLSPVEVRTVTVAQTGMGPEAAARSSRYNALDAAIEEHGAVAVLLGHTLDDQAEQVLLGLARGSGTRSLAGMPARRGKYLRPFLELRRHETLEICDLENLDPWHDPTNTDPRFARTRVRSDILPLLEDQLGPGIAEALYRSSKILAQDAQYLDSLAQDHYVRMRTVDEGEIHLSEVELRELPASLRQRIMALAVAELTGSRPPFERLMAAESLLKRQGSAGPVEVGGHVRVYRESLSQRVPRAGRACGTLVFIKNPKIKTPGACGGIQRRSG
ncbi:tRNA lysidine(34) synthetase TilS [Arthrobacter roseus]|uniref:tRNA lysidine(34) synthetase TilS n=1 Tax=Arthrobacter roseus TaxID=136274 RepID=UPI001965398E|nr:tRNA(Ile)-lysidine synthase [Arthrobacter roseus]